LGNLERYLSALETEQAATNRLAGEGHSLRKHERPKPVKEP
jgi:hypothetical protein